MSILLTILQFWLALSVPAAFMALAVLMAGGEADDA